LAGFEWGLVSLETAFTGDLAGTARLWTSEISDSALSPVKSTEHGARRHARISAPLPLLRQACHDADLPGSYFLPVSALFMVLW
jgi:hypothetical protein